MDTLNRENRTFSSLRNPPPPTSLNEMTVKFKSEDAVLDITGWCIWLAV